MLQQVNGHPHNGTLNNIPKQNCDAHNLYESQRHCSEWKEPGIQRLLLIDYTYITFKNDEAVGMENIAVVSKGYD